MRSGFDFINKHPEYRDRLPPDLEQTFSDKLVAGREPRIVYAPHTGWHVRGYGGLAPGKGTGTPSTSDMGGRVRVGHNSGSGGFALNTWAILDPAAFPRRQWLYGKHYLRRTTSLTAAPGGMGKSSLLLVESLAMATARRAAYQR
jgi:hypothetical protein